MVTVSNSLIQTNALTVKSNAPLSNLLQVGQLLTATIKPLSNNQAQLNIGNQTFIANTKQPITESGTIQVKVNQVSPEVKLSITQPQANPSGNSNTQNIAQTAYRQFIPTQAPLSQVFQQINLLQSLPPSLQTPLQQLLDQATKKNLTLNAGSLKQKLSDSGLFLESKLASSSNSQSTTAIKHDIKNQVLQLQQQVTDLQQQKPSNNLNKLANLLNQALSRLTVQQVQLFENPLVTPLEMPYESSPNHIKDNIEFRKLKKEQSHEWEAYIDSTLNEGLLSVKLKLSENGNIDCYLWCETEILQDKVANQLDRLKQALIDHHLMVNNIQISAQKPVKTDNSTKMALIDIKI